MKGGKEVFLPRAWSDPRLDVGEEEMEKASKDARM
jgi:hypothetical protein